MTGPAEPAQGGGFTSRTVVAALVLVFLGGLFIIALYALTAEAQRPMLLDDLRPLIVGAVAGMPGILATIIGGKVYRENRTQTQQIARVERQTNGELTDRMTSVVSTVLAAELDARGVVPRQREGDSPVDDPAAPSVNVGPSRRRARVGP